MGMHLFSFLSVIRLFLIFFVPQFMDEERIYTFDKKKYYLLAAFILYVAVGIYILIKQLDNNTMSNYVLDLSLFLM